MRNATTPPGGTEQRDDLGFGRVVANARGPRLLNRDGTFNSARIGIGWWKSQELYHLALSVTWPRFLGALSVAYIAANLFFALAFLACGPEALVGAAPRQMGGDFWRAFFFSVETFATIGYGEISPVGVPAHFVMVAESLVALVMQALGTGMVFARFARPTAALRFSATMVVAPFREGRALMFRLVNTRQNEILDLTIRVMCSALDGTTVGMGRRFDRLTLDRHMVEFLPLSWTLVHPITEESPLWGLDEATMRAREMEFLIIAAGVDDTFQQQVHTRMSYRCEEVVWGAKFANMFVPPGPDGRMAVDVRLLDVWEPAALPAWPAASPTASPTNPTDAVP